ncbi:hypothetical protein O162_27000 [Pseudomonas putida SJ3]|uniref:proton-translocating NAD(P)(+) transhydrogenase n=2 Tax=Pseudomonas TaxID=286 RepID=A0A2S3WK26_PSEPU|nr:hypothetical protein O162_27000 [Pseudomonas putida SJ3]ESW37124.1 hypothetical protein O164_25810 [Pseudomonas taiwanensis SJ9]POF99585.1 hypothetical protein BGP82_27450 [Pseudomonas putida]
MLVGMLNPFDSDNLARLAGHGITAFALEAVPRTSRAQSLDVLSSQANIAGYKAVLLAAHHYPRFMPMLMTAAGFLGDWKGQLVCDDFAGYKACFEQGVTEIGRMAHARRKF